MSSFDTSVPDVVRLPTLRKPGQAARVVSIDVGLRNLGLSVVETVEATSSEETLASFVCERLRVIYTENVDVIGENGCTAKNAKAVGMLKHETFWFASAMRRWDRVFSPPPDAIVIEVQAGNNASLRAMAGVILGSLHGVYEGLRRSGQIESVPFFTMVRGDRKLKVCDALLGPETVPPPPPQPTPTETNEEAKEEAASTKPKARFFRGRRVWARSRRADYEKRKERARAGVKELFARCSEGVTDETRSFFASLTKHKQRDVADSVLQGAWAAWEIAQVRKRKRDAV